MLRSQEGPLYIPDTSALIAAWTERYPQDIFPAVWQFIDGLNGRVQIYEEVREEIKRHAPDLLEWLDSSAVDSRLSLGSLGGNAAYVQDHFREIANAWPHWRPVRTGNGADPWVIAYAYALGGVVVSEEQPGGGRDVKIPDVCRQLRVRHVNLLGLFRNEGFGPA